MRYDLYLKRISHLYDYEYRIHGLLSMCFLCRMHYRLHIVHMCNIVLNPLKFTIEFDVSRILLLKIPRPFSDLKQPMNMNLENHAGCGQLSDAKPKLDMNSSDMGTVFRRLAIGE